LICFGANEGVDLHLSWLVRKRFSLSPKKKEYPDSPFLFVHKTGAVFSKKFTGFMQVFIGFPAAKKIPGKGVKP
jgi:hypothetical protein